MVVYEGDVQPFDGFVPLNEFLSVPADFWFDKP